MELIKKPFKSMIWRASILSGKGRGDVEVFGGF
jgi:hypothetical protein